MQERKVPVDAARQQSGILVVGLHDEPAPFEMAKVLGQDEGDPRPPFAERGVGDRVLSKLLDECDPRVLDPPELFGVTLRVGAKRGLGIDHPAGHAVLGSRGAQVRMPAAIFDAAEEQRRAVREPGRARVEYGMDRVGPIGRRQNGIGGVPAEELIVTLFRRHALPTPPMFMRGGALGLGRGLLLSLTTAGRSTARISSRASRYESVDSAP